MDRLESLSNTLSQITLYDIKSMYNQAKNAVLNVSEMDAKVREATNDEPWGASSTLMQEIAQGTFNFQHFNEIMPAIYARFMEKEARQWRQIYKALQLLEYLVKNGSERVVDDARSHIATIKMLRNFYYVDEKGKDQGLNVRNRSRELVELLSDVEKIRTERRKAKTNKHKYTGVGNDPMSFSSGGSRYGGFGSDSLGYSGGTYSGGGGDYSGRDFSSGSYSGGGNGSYSGGGSGGFRDDTSRRGFQEYDAGDDETAPRRSNSISSPARSSPTTTRRASTLPTAPAAPKAPEPVVDLLGMDDDAFGSTSTDTNANKALPVLNTQVVADVGDDDFDDFQTAPPSAAPAAPVVPATQQIHQVQKTARPLSTPLFPQQAPLQSMSPPLQSMTPPVQSMSTMQAMSAAMPPMHNRMGSNSFGTPLTPTTGSTAGRPSYISPATTPMQPMQSSAFGSQPARTTTTSPAPKQAASANFDDLWSMGLGSSASAKPATPSSGPAKSIKEIEKEKAQAGIWGSSQSGASMAAGFGSFGGNVSTPSASAQAPASSAGGFDDLLL